LRIAALLLAVFSAVLIGTLLPRTSAAQDSKPPQPTDEARATCWTTTTSAAYSAKGSGYLLSAGDRLKISIFQRPDLSGEFRIREDGYIALPLLGSIAADGFSVAGVEQEITTSLDKLLGRASSVAAEVVERQPFYVLGLVNNPGARPFTPRTDVLRAIALSGGMFRAPVNVGTTVDVSREAGRLGQSVAEMKRNLVRRARLLAERDGKTTFEPPAPLLELETAERVLEMVEAERRLVRQRIDAHRSEKRGLEATKHLAKEEISALEGQHRSIQAQVELANKESETSQDLLKRGLSRRGDLFTLQRVVANLEADEREVFARIQRAKTNLVATERELGMLDLNRSLRLEEEINTVEQQIAASELSARYSRRIIEDLTGLPAASPTAAPAATSPIRFQIIRQMNAAQVTFDATDATFLCPGDVLRVTPQLGD
jgi:protein involved in polysaccharide export with SLBB domain